MLTGCASASTAKQVAPTPTATAVATIPAPRLPTTLQKAWGNVTIHALPSALPDNRVFVFLNAATPDGQWLIGANEPCDFIANTTRLSYAVLYNIATRQMVTMRALLHPQSQILAASADDRWVVWSEADDQPDFFDWALFAYDRQSGQVRQLGQRYRRGWLARPGHHQSARQRGQGASISVRRPRPAQLVAPGLGESGSL